MKNHRRGDSSVIECSPLNWKVDRSIQD